MACVLCGEQIMMSAEEPQVSSNVRERAGQRPILSSLLGALGEPLPPAAPGVATQVMQGQLRASEERFREEIALHERDRSTYNPLLYSYLCLSLYTSISKFGIYTLSS